MRRLGSPIGALALLAACGGAPDLEIVSDAPPDAARAAAAVAAPEGAAPTGLFSGLLGRAGDTPELADPPETEPVPDEAGVGGARQIADAAQTPPRRGLLGRILAGGRGETAGEPEASGGEALAEAAEAGEAAGADGATGTVGADAALPAAFDPAASDAQAVAAAEMARPAAAPRGRFGLGGFLRGTPSAPEPDESVPLAALTYGQVARACGVKRADLGREVARYPERGAGYALYDSDPTTIALRPHYITGFKDGCPRKFLAALALFGGATAYETTRYKDGRNDTNITETDLRYKSIRASVCGAPVGSGCAERRFARLERRIVFVSVYERFGTNPTWADMLIYDGEVVAKDFKTVQ